MTSWELLSLIFCAKQDAPGHFRGPYRPFDGRAVRPHVAAARSVRGRVLDVRCVDPGPVQLPVGPRFFARRGLGGIRRGYLEFPGEGSGRRMTSGSKRGRQVCAESDILHKRRY